MCITDQNALVPSSFSIDFVACSTPWYLEVGLPCRKAVEAIRFDSSMKYNGLAIGRINDYCHHPHLNDTSESHAYSSMV